MDNPSPPEDLTPKTIIDRLKAADAKVVPSAEGKYQFPPFLQKATWAKLGDQMVQAEKLELFKVPGHKWISLRLDGHGFSNLTKKLKRAGVLENGYSATMASWMQECCTSLMEFTSAKYGYTQSDEITVLIPPAPLTTKGDQACHFFSGRKLKICTLAASHVTLVWNKNLGKVAPQDWSKFYSTFDCRMGCYDTLEEAMSLILWRSHDCSINGIADACLHQKGKIDGAKAAVGLPTNKKMEFLASHNLLPLQDHQAYGSYYARVKRIKEAINPQTNQSVTCLRSVIEKIEGNVLNLAVAGALTPEDEKIEGNVLNSDIAGTQTPEGDHQ